jgi:hypothetical protein
MTYIEKFMAIVFATVAITAILYSDYYESDQEINVLDMQLKHCEYIPNYYLKDHHEKLTDIRERLNILIERAK